MWHFSFQRISADAALNHEWFREVPLPKSKEFMPTFPAQHAQDRYLTLQRGIQQKYPFFSDYLMDSFKSSECCIRRLRRILKSPDPLEDQHRNELQQGELGNGGLFG